MEQSSSSDIQHKDSDFTKGGKETRQTSKESVFELREGSHGGVSLILVFGVCWLQTCFCYAHFISNDRNIQIMCYCDFGDPVHLDLN